MTQGKASLSILFVFLSLFAVSIFNAQLAFAAEEPVIEKIFSYQPESNLPILQTVVIGKNLEKLSLDYDICPNPDSKIFNTMAIFRCHIFAEKGHRQYKAVLRNKNIVIKELEVDFYKTDRIYGWTINQRDGVFVERAGASLDVLGNASFSVYGVHLPKTLSIETDCEDELKQVSYSEERVEFWCHISHKILNQAINNFLVKESPNGHILYNYTPWQYDGPLFYIPTVHITPFLVGGASFYEIYAYASRNYHTETWENDVRVSASFCKKIWHIPDFFRYSSEFFNGERFICEPNGINPHAESVSVTYSPTNTLLWPIKDDENKGYFVTKDGSENGQYITSKNNVVFTGKYIRSLIPPNVPYYRAH